MMNNHQLGPTSEKWVAPIAARPYKDAVRTLTAKNRALTTQLAETGRRHRDEVRTLKAQLREGLTPELIALRKELTSWRNRALAAEGRLKETKNAR